MERGREALELLSETAIRLLETHDPQEIINELCRKVMAHLHCDVFIHYLADTATKRLRLAACAGIPAEVARDIDWIDYGIGLCGSVALEGVPIIAEDASLYSDPRGERLRSLGIRSYACHPLFSGGGVIGTLAFASRARIRFDEEDVSMMRRVSDQVAVAMDRARLLEALRNARDALETRVRERTAELEAANASLQTEIEERARTEEALRETTRALDERVREVNCLYAISSTAEKNGIRLKEKLRSMVNILPSGWRYPEAAGARIRLEGVECRTGNFRETSWNQKSRVRIRGEVVGTVEVHYLEERPPCDEGPFRREERTLIDAVAARLGEMVDRLRFESAVFSSLDVLIAYMDRQFRFIVVNRAYAHAVDLPAEFLAGRNHFDLFPDAEHERAFRRVIETGEPHTSFEQPFLYPGYTELQRTFWDYKLQPVKRDDGQVTGLVLGMQNVTERVRAQEAARQEHALRKSIEDSMVCGIAAVDMQGRQTYVNPAFCSMVGWSQGELLGGTPPYLYVPPQEATAVRQIMRAMRNEESPGPIEVRLRRRDGERFDARVLQSPLRDAQGRRIGWIGSVTDITGEKEGHRRSEVIQELLHLFSKESDRKEYLDGVLELIRRWSGCRCVGIRVLDRAGKVPYLSCAGFGKRFIRSESRLSVGDGSCACLRVVGGRPEPLEKDMMTRSGSFVCNDLPFFLASLPQEEKARFLRAPCARSDFRSFAVIPIRHKERVLGAIQIADEKEGSVPPRVTDFIETVAPLIGEAVNRFNLEEELRASETRFRVLSSHLITVQENERKRIAREIHDSIGQALSAIKYRVEDVLQREVGPQSRERLEGIVPICQQAVQETRRLQADLRPSALDDLGIAAALKSFLRRYQSTYPRIAIKEKVEPEIGDIPEFLAAVLYRITQEGLNNVAKHSDASRVAFSLCRKGSQIELTLRDNGAGFDLEKAEMNETAGRGMGLAGMRERAALSGGKLQIRSAKGRGTTIRATWKAPA
ncbi:MAG: PAS domain S-box protein [bacterium]